MNPAPNLVLVGPMGAGKSSIGRRLAERLGLDFVDADRRCRSAAGATIATIFELEGEAGFREREKRAAGRAAGTATASWSPPAAARCWMPATARCCASAASWSTCRSSVDAQLQRLGRDRSRPLLQRGDREQVLQRAGRACANRCTPKWPT